MMWRRRSGAAFEDRVATCQCVGVLSCSIGGEVQSKDIDWLIVIFAARCSVVFSIPMKVSCGDPSARDGGTPASQGSSCCLNCCLVRHVHAWDAARPDLRDAKRTICACSEQNAFVCMCARRNHLKRVINGLVCLECEHYNASVLCEALRLLP